MILELITNSLTSPSTSYLITRNEDEADSLACLIQSAFPNELIGIACYRGYFDAVVIPS